jgi:hypothetical protein
MTNISLIIFASLAQFILGALWYSPLMFGKLWMQIMEVTHLSKDELQKMQKEMTPFYALQFFLTLFTTFSFANLVPYIPDFSAYHIAFWIWIGFIVPTQIACIIWANTKKKFWFKQAIIMNSYQLIAIMLMALILSL